MTVVPYKDKQSTKKKQVEEMFDNISHRYDFLNHFLSLGIDKGWRKKAIRMLKEQSPSHVLDIATGTADFAIAASHVSQNITGIDISNGMLEVGRKKLKDKGLDSRITLVQADSENLPFETKTFDAAIVAFGVRNFENLEKGLQDIFRVLKPGSRFIVLEFSQPGKFPFKQVYRLYFKNILPVVGAWLSKDKSAYSYLPESVDAFPYGDAFLQKLNQVGFVNTTCTPLTFGISSIYSAFKP